jgi:hypothetical protein
MSFVAFDGRRRDVHEPLRTQPFEVTICQRARLTGLNFLV